MLKECEEIRELLLKGVNEWGQRSQHQRRRW